MTKDVPTPHHHDLDYLVEMLDWDANVNPEFASRIECFLVPFGPLWKARRMDIANNGCATGPGSIQRRS
jgi:hypothetical protein